MENYIALLLLIVPGFIARKIYKQTNNVREDLSQFEETLYCLATSLVIGIISLWVAGAYFTNDISTIKGLFGNITFIRNYALTCLLISIPVGFLIYASLRIYNKVINVARGNNKGQVVLSTTVFDERFNDGNYHFVEVYKDDKLLGRGMLNDRIEKYKELYLIDSEKAYKELLQSYEVEKFPYKGIYIDGKSGIVIKEINLPSPRR